MSCVLTQHRGSARPSTLFPHSYTYTAHRTAVRRAPPPRPPGSDRMESMTLSRTVEAGIQYDL